MSLGRSGRAGVRVGVLALQGDVREHVAVLGSLGAEAVLVRSPKDVAGIQALVVPGGESTTMSMLIESSHLDVEIEKMVADSLPMLGTCAGMILLAYEVLDGRPDQRSFGAIDLTVRRNAFGRQRDSFETDLEITGVEGPVHAVFIRAPVVERVGEGVSVLAEVEVPAGQAGVDGTRRPVVCAAGNVIVAAFHPELAGDGRLHELLLHKVEGD